MRGPRRRAPRAPPARWPASASWWSAATAAAGAGPPLGRPPGEGGPGGAPPAASAAEASAHLDRASFDVLVSDIGMPGEDGHSLLRRIRALGPSRGGDIPAVALTAYA